MTSATDIGNLAVARFSGILGFFISHQPPILLTVVSDLTRAWCSPSEALSLARPLSAEEIQSTLFKLNPNKSPGPDGLISGFYKAAWSSLGEEVLNSTSQFFANSVMPRAVNATILTLIPKFPGATLIKDYRPISCCNTLYKLISKLLVARLKPLIPKLIQPNQTTLIKERLLLENCILASEIVNGYHKDKGPKRVALKIDISKAFDSIIWDFLTTCLQALQFPDIYINWLKECYTTTSYSVCINGRLHGFFRCSRGLRQGDPLSPYLFGLVMNILSQKLNDAAVTGRFSYHPRCQDSGLIHLCFADDLLIFSDGSKHSIQDILSVLDEFKQLSGLAISPESCFFACGLKPEDINYLYCHHIRVPSRLSTYLLFRSSTMLQEALYP